MLQSHQSSHLLTTQLQPPTSLLLDYSIYKDTFKTLESLADGGFATVYKVQNVKNGKLFAKKCVKVQGAQGLTQGIQQILTCKRLEHQRVIKVHHFYLKEGNQPGKLQLGIIMELGAMSLQKFIIRRRASKQYLNLKFLDRFAHDFLELFSLFQKQQISHRDIKPANFILMELPSPTSQHLHCKIADFGLSKHYQTPLNSEKYFAGTLDYASPQLKRKLFPSHHPHSNQNLSTSSHIKNDMYSFGLTLYELIMLQSPQTRPQSLQLLKKNIAKRLSKELALYRIIMKALQQDQNDRPTFIQLYKQQYGETGNINKIGSIVESNTQKIIKESQKHKIEKVQYKKMIQQPTKTINIDDINNQIIQIDSNTSLEINTNIQIVIPKQIKYFTKNQQILIKSQYKIQKTKIYHFINISEMGIILLGCDLGRIKVIYQNKVYQLIYQEQNNKTMLLKTQKNYDEPLKKPITKLKKLEDQIWIVGCDSKLIILNINNIKKSLQNIISKQNTQTIKKYGSPYSSSLFNTSKTLLSQNQIKNNLIPYDSSITKVPISGLTYHHIPNIKYGINTLQILSKLTYAIGYYSGYIYLYNTILDRQSNKIIHQKTFFKMIFSSSVTCLKFHPESSDLWCSADDGMIKKIKGINKINQNESEIQLQNAFFRCNSSILSFQFTNNSTQIQIFCQNGQFYKITTNFHLIQHQTYRCQPNQKISPHIVWSQSLSLNQTNNNNYIYPHIRFEQQPIFQLNLQTISNFANKQIKNIKKEDCKYGIFYRERRIGEIKCNGISSAQTNGKQIYIGTLTGQYFICNIQEKDV